MSEYLDRVAKIQSDPEQWEAFNRPFEPDGRSKSCVVIAGPGSGKTYLLTTEVARLLFEKIPAPRGVACLTYSNFLARQLEIDFRKLGVFSNPRLFVGTVHSFCLAEIIHPYQHLYEEIGNKLPQPFRIASKEQSEGAICLALFEQGIDYCASVDISKWGQGWQNLLGDLAKYRRRFSDYNKVVFENARWSRLGSDCVAILRRIDWSRLARQYVETLLNSDKPAIDFTEIEILALRMVQQYDFVRTILLARYPWLVIDEYQDLGTPFHQMVSCLISSTELRIFAIGDPDQCIYEEMSGTQPEYIEKLANRILIRDHSERIKLNRNYRCAQRLIDMSEKVLGQERGYKALEDGGVCDCYQCVNEDEQRTRLFEHILPRLINADDSSQLQPKDVAILHPWRRTGVNVLSSQLDNFENRWPHVLDKDVDYDSRHSKVLMWLEQAAQWCLYGWCSGNPYFRDLLPFWVKLNTDPESQSLDESRFTLQLRLFEVLWKLREGKKPFNFRNWFSLVRKNLNLQPLLATYEVVAPDDVGEFNRLTEALESERLSNWSLARFAKGPGRIQLTTFHSSKGTQFKAVVIMGIDKLEVLNPGLTEQNRRLAYVAVTRARKQLFILYEGQPQILTDLRDSYLEGCTFWQRCSTRSGQVSWQVCF